MKHWKNNLMLLSAALIWGCAFVAQSVSMDYIGPWTFTCIRSFIGGVTLLAVMPLLDRFRSAPKEHSKAQWKNPQLLKGGIACGIILGFASMSQQIGIQYTSVGKAGFITAMYVVLVPVLSVFLGNRPKLKTWISVALAVIGLYFLSIQGSMSLSVGDLWMIGCAFLFAVHILVIDHFSPMVDGVRMSCIQFFVAGLVCLTAVLLFWRYRRDEVKQLIHRQKLARMVLENKWYESEQRKEDAFFKDLSSSRSKETITYFPKIYYRMKQGLLHIRVEITLGKYQEQLLNLEKKLESGLYCELTDKELKDSYVEYTLLYDTIANRISIEDVQAKDGRLRLMENVWWEYDKLPHMLIAGGTGGGKTYFILTLIEALLRTNAVLFVLDPKNADLADLQAVMPDVYYKKEDMLDCIDRFYEEMMKRSEDMKLMENYRTGENYAYLGLPANFLIFDEYVAFMEMLGTKENAAVLNKLKQIVMLGRQAGFFLILACQRPDAKYLGDGIRDQFNFRVALGRMSEMGYGMMFGETTKDFFLKQIKGRGYVDVGTSVISEFYTPLVPKGHDFLKEIKKLIDSRQGVQAACEAKAAETD